MIAILANGSYPSAAAPLQLLAEAERVVCCDGAAESYIGHGGQPDVIIGDLDSVPQALLHDMAGRIVRVAEQDTNDLSKAFRYCLEKGWTDVVILGATGKREDHTLGNIALLADFAEKMPGIRMVTDDGTFFVVFRKAAFPAVQGQEISLFALRPGTHIFSEGLEYPLDGMAPERLWQATLNVAAADTVSISVKEDFPVIVFMANVNSN